MRLKRLLALAMAVCMVAVMLPVTAMAANDIVWVYRLNFEELDDPAADMNINRDSCTIGYRSESGITVTDVTIPPMKSKSGKIINFKYSSTNANNDPNWIYVDVYTEWTPDDPSEYVVEDAKFTLSNGGTIICPFKLVVTDKSDMTINVFDGSTRVNPSRMVVGKTYTVKARIDDLASNNSSVGWKPIEWFADDYDTNKPIDGAVWGKTTGKHPEYTTTVRFDKVTDKFSFGAEIRNEDGDSAFGAYSVAVTDGTPPPAVDNSFYFLNGDEKIYPGSHMPISVSVNKNNVWDGKRFVSNRLVTSVSSDSKLIEVRLGGVRHSAEDNLDYGRVDIKIKDNDSTPLVWEKEDIGKTRITGNITVRFNNGTTAIFKIDETVGDHAYVEFDSAKNSAGESVEGKGLEYSPTEPAKNVYTYTFALKDLGNAIKDKTDVSTKWVIRNGEDVVSLKNADVTANSNGIMTNELTAKGRGRVVMTVDDEIDVDDYRGRTSQHTLSFNVKGGALPIGVSSITNAPITNKKMTLDVPSTSKLGADALAEIKKTAAEGVVLKLSGNVSMAIGVSGLDDADFLEAIGDKGFDPLVIPAAPAEAEKTNINIGRGQWLDFAHNGALPGETSVTVPVEADDNGKTIFDGYDEFTAWQFKGDKLVKDTTVPVDFDEEYLTVTLTHCSAWAIYPAGYNPNTDTWDNNDNNNDKNDGGSSSGNSSSAPSYPTAEKGLEGLAKIKDLTPGNLPANAKLTKTAAGKDIAVIPVTLVNGAMGVTDLAKLGKLGANVGLEIKQNGVDIILPGGFGAITEPGRFAYPMAYNKVAENKAELLAAVKGEGALSFTCTIGGNVTLPVVATVTLTTDIKKDGNVNVYRYDAATGKPVFVAKSKVVGGKVIFATKQLGQFMVTTGSI